MDTALFSSRNRLGEFRDELKRKEKPNVKDIHNHMVTKWASKWRQLGTQLNIDKHLMDNIEHDHPSDCESCCYEMFTEWLDSNPAASWNDIITAVDNLLLYGIGHEDVLKAAKLLCDCYIQSRYIPSDDNDWPPYHPKHYTPLTIVHHEGRCTESEVLAGVQAMKSAGITEGSKGCGHFHDKTTKSINELLDPFENLTNCPYMILIEGVPGIGKTIMSKEIAIQWANKDLLKTKKLLFLLFLRDPMVKNIKNVQSLVKYFCQSDNLTNKITDWLIETGGEYLTIVVDGYDEISKEKRGYCIIDNIIKRQILPNCSVVITSRPTFSVHLHDKVSCRAEILGFSREGQQSFIQNALKDKKDKIKELRGFLQSNPSLNVLWYIPLNMSILLCLTTEGISALPKTQTCLYQKFILISIVHFLKKDKIVDNTTLTSLDNLPHPYDQIFNELSQFAFFALQKDQIVFTLPEVQSQYPNLSPTNWYGLGILKSAQYFKAQDGCDHQSFHFLHYSIQEYMAAYYIASLPGNELLQLLRETFWNVHYFNTWVMYVGITGGKHFMFAHFLTGNYFQISSWLFGTQKISNAIMSNKIKCLHLLQCSAEAEHEMLSSVQSAFQDEIIDLSNQILSGNEVRTLAALLVRLPRKKWKKLNLSGCLINNEACNLLCELLLPNNVALQVTTVDISDNRFHWESLQQLCQVLKRWKVSELIISYEALYDRTTAKMVNSFKRRLHKKLYKFGYMLMPSSQNVLLTYLPEKEKMIAVFTRCSCTLNRRRCSCTLNCYVFNNCVLNDDLAEKICSFILRIRNRKSACIPLVNINLNVPNDLANNKLSIISSHCHQIVFNGSHIHSRGILMLNHVSGVMYIEETINSVADLVMATIVHSYSNSKKPYLKAIPASFTKLFKESLQDYSGFKHFCANNTNLNSRVAIDLATILSYNTNLNKLCLGGNCLQSTGATKIALGLRNITSITSLILGDNIGKEAVDHIASVLCHNTKLKTLMLSNNNFQTAGAIKLAKALQNTFTLTTFGIADNGINKGAANEIANVLYHNTKLQQLQLGGNNLQAVGTMRIAKALQNTATLTEFGIAGNNASEEAADDISTALSHKSFLQKLDLSGNNFQTVGIIKISKALKNISKLQDLNISSNSISDEAAGDIAAALSQNNELVKLDLHHNELQAAGVITIAEELQNITTLEVLNISGNNIGKQAIDDIVDTLSHITKLEIIS